MIIENIEQAQEAISAICAWVDQEAKAEVMARPPRKRYKTKPEIAQEVMLMIDKLVMVGMVDSGETGCWYCGG